MEMRLVFDGGKELRVELHEPINAKEKHQRHDQIGGVGVADEEGGHAGGPAKPLHEGAPLRLGAETVPSEIADGRPGPEGRRAFLTHQKAVADPGNLRRQHSVAIRDVTAHDDVAALVGDDVDLALR